jgi:hypothetical protein
MVEKATESGDGAEIVKVEVGRKYQRHLSSIAACHSELCCEAMASSYVVGSSYSMKMIEAGGRQRS